MDELRTSPVVAPVRVAALDAARGLAVVGMVYLHLLPTEGGRSAFERALAGLARALEGKPAALFCVLAGLSWSLQAERARDSTHLPVYVARRALALGLVGLALAVSVWPTEVLTALALMMPLCFAIQRHGRRGVALAVVLLLASVPFAINRWGEYAANDWNADGTHVAETEFGWVTLRFYLFDGNYPLLPWLAFALVGALCTALLQVRRRARAAFALALPLAAALQVYASWAAAHFDEDAPLAPQLTATWVPTSLPFFALAATASLAVISGALLLEGAAPRLFACLRWLAVLGRASLTHYLLHVLAVFVPLRHFYPEEDWSAAVGAASFVGYFAFAIPASLLWFEHHRRGPLEALWAAVGGRAR